MVYIQSYPVHPTQTACLCGSINDSAVDWFKQGHQYGKEAGETFYVRSNCFLDLIHRHLPSASAFIWNATVKKAHSGHTKCTDGNCGRKRPRFWSHLFCSLQSSHSIREWHLRLLNNQHQRLYMLIPCSLLFIPFTYVFCESKFAAEWTSWPKERSFFPNAFLKDGTCPHPVAHVV